MKRNELRNLGLTPEQIDAVMTMNGNDVNREKIERDSAGPEFIMTKWGVGYYFTDKD